MIEHPSLVSVDLTNAFERLCTPALASICQPALSASVLIIMNISVNFIDVQRKVLPHLNAEPGEPVVLVAK